MEIADCTIQAGFNTLFIKNMTAAEAACQIATRLRIINQNALLKKENVRDEPIDPVIEGRRLRLKFGASTFDKIFGGGMNVRLPSTFEEAERLGLGTSFEPEKATLV